MEKDIEIDRLTIHYDELGNPEGAPVVLMHGWGCDHTTVASVANILSSGMHVYSIDLPGHGKSMEPPSSWGTSDYATLIEKFIEKMGLISPSLIGHSFGGRTAIMMASRGKYHKVMLIDSAGIKPRHKIGYYWKVYIFKAFKLLSTLFYGKKSKEIIEKQRKKRGSADYRNSSPVMREVMSRCINEDLKKVMPYISAPVLLVWGDEDTATPLRDAKTMERLMPGAGLVSFDGCGHYSFLDNPFGFKAAVNSFFKEELKIR